VNSDSIRPAGALPALLVAAALCLFAGAYADGAFGGGIGFVAGIAGFAAYLFLFSRAIGVRRSGPRRISRRRASP